MAEVPAPEITDNDRLLAAIAYPIPLVALIILLVEDMRGRAFQKYHAVQALAYAVAVFVVFVALFCIQAAITAVLDIGVIRFLLNCLCLGIYFVPFLGALWFAYQAYQGEYLEIPILTDLLKQQGWIEGR